MLLSTRRAFLGASLATMSSGTLFGKPKATSLIPKGGDDPPFQPTTLFLTWQRDPPTTMTVHWIGTRGETADTSVYYAAAPDGDVQSQESAAKPYPMTDFKVFRAELTGLTPGTDYLFRIGKGSPVYRFRTMPSRA